MIAAFVSFNSEGPCHEGLLRLHYIGRADLERERSSRRSGGGTAVTAFFPENTPERAPHASPLHREHLDSHG